MKYALKSESRKTVFICLILLLISLTKEKHQVISYITKRRYICTFHLTPRDTIISTPEMLAAFRNYPKPNPNVSYKNKVFKYQGQQLTIVYLYLTTDGDFFYRLNPDVKSNMKNFQLRTFISSKDFHKYTQEGHEHCLDDYNRVVLKFSFDKSIYCESNEKDISIGKKREVGHNPIAELRSDYMSAKNCDLYLWQNRLRFQHLAETPEQFRQEESVSLVNVGNSSGSNKINMENRSYTSQNPANRGKTVNSSQNLQSMSLMPQNNVKQNQISQTLALQPTSQTYESIKSNPNSLVKSNRIDGLQNRYDINQESLLKSINLQDISFETINQSKQIYELI